MPMTPVARAEILPLGDYEAIRPHFRARVVEAKKARRMPLGDNMSAVFENRDSVLMQVQEMLRTERITNEEGIAHELATYNDLLPGAGQLSLTVFVEISDKEAREVALVELAGIENTIALEVDGERLVAKGKNPELHLGRTTAVHYLKIDVGEAQAAKLKAPGASVAMVVDHPRYQARHPLSAVSVRALAEDLA
jgi:uncharacterized glyoxalase superfamily protein PhnB